MNNSVRAKALLYESDYNLVLFKDGEATASKDRGIASLLKEIEGGKNYCGYAAADKVVGRAAAFLYVILGVNSLYAKVISQSAADLIKASNISLEYDELVPYIINRTGDGMCQIEQAVLNITDPAEAITALVNKLESFKK